MTKKKIHKLAFEFEDDFTLVGIASHENDYRLSWAINKSLNISLKKKDDLCINHPKHKIEIKYSTYSYYDQGDLISYYLISNKSEQGFLLWEMKNIDFILRISTANDVDIIHDLLAKLKKIDIVIAAFSLTDLSEKQKKMFVF